MRIGLVLWMAVVLSACSPAVENPIAPQEWDGVVFEIQTRPTVLKAGMNEFLVLATEPRGRPVHDLVVSLRMDEADPWRQAIQDGHSGVYRRALGVPPSATSVSISVRRKKTEHGAELTFPITLATP